MGKGKKGGGKAVNRDMANLNNHRSVLKHNGTMGALTTAYRTYGYIDKGIAFADDCADYLYHRVNYPLVQSLLFLGSAVPSGFMTEFETHVSKSLTRMGIFSHLKPMGSHSAYKPSMFAYVNSGIVSAFNNFYPNIHADAHALYIKTLCILFEYERDLIESKFSNISENKSWFSNIYNRAVSLCILNHIYNNIFHYIKEDKIGYDGIVNSVKSVSDEAKSESVKRNISILLSPNKSGSPGNFASCFITEFSNPDLKNYMTAQINMCEKAIGIDSEINFLCSKTNEVRVLPKNETNPTECYPFSFEHLNNTNGFGSEYSAYVEIARMDLSDAENKNIGVLADKDYYDKLLLSFDFIDAMAKPNSLLEYLCYLRMEYFYAFKENEFTEKCASLDKEIRELKSAVKSEKREREKVEKGLQAANDTIADMNSRESVILKDNEVVVSKDVISKYDSTISDLEKKVAELTNSLSKASGKCEWQEKQISQLEEVVASYDNYDKELLELRGENIYLSSIIEKMEDLNKEDEDVKQKRFEEQLSAIKDIPILFVGGIGDMMSKFKDIFPNSDYIDVSDEGVNFSVPPRFQYVVLYTRSITHPHCYRVESQVPRERIIFMSMSNTELVVDELYKRIVNGGYSEV